MNAVSVMGGAINSASLTDYQLTKAHQSLLTKFDKLCRDMELANKKAPCLRLSRVDYVEMNQRVTSQSEGARSLATVTYKGYPILSAAE